MNWIITSIWIGCLLSPGLSAPVELSENAKEKRRDSTIETIQLEEALKRLSGEDKKFDPAPGQPQVDGLDEFTNDNEPINEEIVDEPINEEDKGPISDAIEAEPIDDEDESALVNLDRIQTAEDSPNQLIPNPDFSINDINNNISDIEDESNLDPVYIDYGGNQYQDYYTDNYRGNYPPEPSQYGYNGYHSEAAYPGIDRYGEMESRPSYITKNDDDDDDDDDDEYLLQNMVRLVQQHPKFMQMLQNGQDIISEEDRDGYGQDEDNLDQLKNSPSGGRTYLQDVKDEDISNQAPVLENDEDSAFSEHESHSELPSQPAMQKQPGYDANEYDSNFQDKEILEQIETLQELYGDAGAHTVAKKMGYKDRNVMANGHSVSNTVDDTDQTETDMKHDAGSDTQAGQEDITSNQENRLPDFTKISMM